jgi:hypothetical protein
MNQGLFLIAVSDKRNGKPGGGFLVGLSSLTADGNLLQVFNQVGGLWINPHVTTGSDGMGVFSLGWDDTQIGDTTSE